MAFSMCYVLEWFSYWTHFYILRSSRSSSIAASCKLAAVITEEPGSPKAPKSSTSPVMERPVSSVRKKRRWASLQCSWIPTDNSNARAKKSSRAGKRTKRKSSSRSTEYADLLQHPTIHQTPAIFCSLLYSYLICPHHPNAVFFFSARKHTQLHKSRTHTLPSSSFLCSRATLGHACPSLRKRDGRLKCRCHQLSKFFFHLMNEQISIVHWS